MGSSTMLPWHDDADEGRTTPTPSVPSEPGSRAASHEPLAVRMRPRTLDQLRGQAHCLQPGSPLRRLIDGGSGVAGPISVVMWGPPGTGKTTVARLIAAQANREFVELAAVSSGVKDLRAVIEKARHELSVTGRHTVLFVDEIHRFSKSQQDALLPAVENRWVILVAATTENPSFSVISPLLSRSLLITLHPLGEEDLKALITDALEQERGLDGAVVISEEAMNAITRMCAGDARKALTIVEAAAGVATDTDPADDAVATITVDDVEQALPEAFMRYDAHGDQHYDVASALIKSLRGSDVDAALHYVARMLVAGEDPRFICRRLMIFASEDIGVADSQALVLATSALTAVSTVGMPEARIIVGHVVTYLALAPKSNAAYMAINAAMDDLREGQGDMAIPLHVRGTGYSGASALGHGEGYQYPHDHPWGVVQQQYAPDALVDRQYYHPTTHGEESRLGSRWAGLRRLLRGEEQPAASTAPAQGES